MSDSSERDDAARLRAIAAAARELGMQVTVLRVGDITLQLAEPWGESKPARAKQPAPMPADVTPDDIFMQKLRDLSMRNFARLLPDSDLRKLAPIWGVKMGS